MQKQKDHIYRNIISVINMIKCSCRLLHPDINLQQEDHVNMNSSSPSFHSVEVQHKTIQR